MILQPITLRFWIIPLAVIAIFLMLSGARAETYLVSKARSYIGTNPTGWHSLWCGRFMAMVAPEAARRIRNPNMARDWAGLPHVHGQVGAIAVLRRGKRGGHVGVVSGFDSHRNPIVISGNHNRVVGEGVYPKSRVIAYVAAPNSWTTTALESRLVFGGSR